jgi:hypothetical protein
MQITRRKSCLVGLALTAAGVCGCPFFNPGGNSGPSTTVWNQRTINGNAAVRPVFTATADFDGDGKLDAIAAYTGTVAAGAAVFVFFQESTDNFTAVRVGGGADFGGMTSLAVADLDGDSRLDVVAACNGRLLYLHSPTDPREAAGWTTTTIDQSTGTNVGPWNDVTVGQLDAAAGPDIVACNPSIARWSWFRSPAANIANGTGWTRTDIDADADKRVGTASVALVDFNFDGRLDLVSTSQDGNIDPRIAWYANPADPTVSANWTQYRVGNLSAATRLAIADLDADGLSDVIAVNGIGRQIAWYKRPSDATTAWSGYVLTQFTSATPVDVKTADIDGSGQIDVVVGASNGGLFRWFSPTPGYAQTAQWTENMVRNLVTSVNPFRFALGDIDGDGRPDVVAPLQGSATSQDVVVWLENPE